MWVPLQPGLIPVQLEPRSGLVPDLSLLVQAAVPQVQIHRQSGTLAGRSHLTLGLCVQVCALAMFIILHISQVLPVDTMKVIEPGHTSRLQLPDRVQGGLRVLDSMVEALHVSSDMVRSAADQLGLECKPVD